MSTLTREQIQELTPDAQEAVAFAALSDSKRQTRLLEKARRYRGQIWIPALMLPALLLVFFCSDKWLVRSIDVPVAVLMIVIVYVVTQFQVNGINRRLDALMELLEPDFRTQTKAVGRKESKPLNG